MPIENQNMKVATYRHFKRTDHRMQRKTPERRITHKKVTVVMPAYNGEKYVESAIKSILEQTLKDFELIIVDDCSTDSTWKIIQQFAKKDKRIKVFRNQKNLGLSLTLNKALKLANGKYIARADNDDLSYPSRLLQQYNFLEENEHIGIVGGAMELISESGKKIGKRVYHTTDSKIRKYIFFYSPFAHPLIMIRKAILDKAGYYDPLFSPADDYELYFRIGQLSKFANLPDVLMQYRISSGSMTSQQTKKMELATIRVRKMYANVFPYQMSSVARIYNFLHYISIFFIPHGYKRFLFDMVRNK